MIKKILQIFPKIVFHVVLFVQTCLYPPPSEEKLKDITRLI